MKYLILLIIILFLLLTSCLANMPPSHPKIGQTWEYTGKIISIESENVTWSNKPILTYHTKDGDFQELPSPNIPTITVGKTYNLTFIWQTVPVFNNGIKIGTHTGWEIISAIEIE